MPTPLFSKNPTKEMASLSITDSSNIAVLDLTIVADLCQGKFFLDISDSEYLASGALNVLGASFKIVNPYGVTVRDYTTSGYDIANDSPAMQGVAEFSIPTQAGNYQYGTYKITAKLTDEDGTEYELEKSVKICVPDSKHTTRNYGTLSAKLSGICKEGKVYVVVDTPPNYNSKVVESQENDFTIYYPSDAQEAEESTLSSFSVQLYEGEYKLQGELCATYNYGDNVYVLVRYKVKRVKAIKCIIDECCVFGKLAELHKGLSEKCTQKEIDEIGAIAFDTLRLLKTAQLAAECGEDPSDYITELEAVLGCPCTCNCLEGTPLINNNPSKDFVIEGCNVSKTTVGLTDTYTIENYQYEIVPNANGGVLTITEGTLLNCTKTFTLSFNIAVLYKQVKGLASADYLAWAAIMNQAWTGLDTSCLGYSEVQWNAMTFVQRSQAIFNAFCTGGVCLAEVETDEKEANGSDVTLSWTEGDDVYEVAVYMDDILRGTVLAGAEEFTIAGAADGNEHSYAIIAKCQNGVIGNALTGTFTYSGCPTIAVPTLTVSSVTGGDCPYDLTSLVEALPSGIEAEWHSANNTSAASLVADEENVLGGTYYVFAKDQNNCYSLGVKFTLTCTEDTGCSAPQNLTVENITDGFRVRFASAAFPPSSYTVKRKPAASADVDGSYTTIGTPTYNAGEARWEILDETAVDNTLYTYKAISNCDSSSPAILYNFANITCPTLTLTPGETDVAYSFVPVGGDVDEYIVEVYNSAGTSRLTWDTIVPAFSNPETGTLLYLDAGTSYKARMKVSIGDYQKVCDFQVFSTGIENTLVEVGVAGVSLDDVLNNDLDFITFTGGDSLPLTDGETATGTHTSISGIISLVITGAFTACSAQLIKNMTVIDCIDIPSAGTYEFGGSSFLTSDQLAINVVVGACV